jgi:hypothetical protein
MPMVEIISYSPVLTSRNYFSAGISLPIGDAEK